MSGRLRGQHGGLLGEGQRCGCGFPSFPQAGLVEGPQLLPTSAPVPGLLGAQGRPQRATEITGRPLGQDSLLEEY